VIPKRRCILLAATALLVSSVCAAQSDEERAAAQTLFDAGQKLIEDGEVEKACAKFQASQELDPSVGTQLNLGDCYEKLGKTASAWINFTEVVDRTAQDDRRKDYAKERADSLAARLVRLTIEVEDPAPDMTIRRGKTDVAKATWGAAVPVDPGSYDLIARAPERLPWRETVEVAGEGETVTITVPALVEQESPADEPPPPPEPTMPDEGGGGQRIAGITLLAAGGVGIGIGAVLAGLAHSKASESNDFCLPEDTNQCTQEGVDLRESAQGLQIGYVASLSLGSVAAVAGLITLLTADDGPVEGDSAGLVITPLVGPTGAYLGIGASF
jgi:hypothetical protein